MGHREGKQLSSEIAMFSGRNALYRGRFGGQDLRTFRIFDSAARPQHLPRIF
jgi:hypothetical protein